ncbi:phosphotransferase family protein [Telmatobacter bradus]|uniref:phosphotransferase family protein n=1 Tax=Telmatobacter bradus TaxID=474953 RepID=UPI003B427E57
MTNYTEYRLAFLLPQTLQLLAIKGRREAELPRIGIPKWSRAAEQLTGLICKKWNIRTTVLDLIESDSGASPCAILEVRTPKWRSEQAGFSAVALNHISLSDNELQCLMGILLDNDTTCSPFSRPGWIVEAQRWIQESDRNRVVEFSEEINQLSTGGHFVLVRFGTRKGPAYWLKATGLPNAHEFTVTRTLAQHFPQFLPPLVAAREDWNAWVMEEVGRTLCEDFSSSNLARATRSLASLQNRSISLVDNLIFNGCCDQRLPRIESQIDPWMDYLEEVMEYQVSTKVPRLGRSELSEIGGVLHAACDQMQELEIPDSLTHNDINPGNILLDDTRCVFIDWAEASVGNPFLTFQLLMQHVVRQGEGVRGWEAQARSIYKELWLNLLPEPVVDRAFILAPVLAIASCLYGRGDWLNSPRRADFDFQSYTRSLARHLHRATRSPELLEALCI